MVTAGANQAFTNVVLTLLDAKDSVVLFKPYYFNHLMAVQMTGGGANTILGRYAQCVCRTLHVCVHSALLIPGAMHATVAPCICKLVCPQRCILSNSNHSKRPVSKILLHASHASTVVILQATLRIS